MDILNDKTDAELLKSLVSEVAKSTKEIRCAQNDLAKANGRLSFALVLTNELINRQEINK
jgi:hypothetical protein